MSSQGCQRVTEVNDGATGINGEEEEECMKRSSERVQTGTNIHSTKSLMQQSRHGSDTEFYSET